MAYRKTSLQLKVGSIFLLLALAFNIGSYVALQWIVFPVFTQLEQEEAKEDLSRVKQLLDSELSALSNIGSEYSQWTTTWRFLQGEVPNYAADNLDSASWDAPDIEMMMFFDLKGKMIWGQVLDPLTGALLASNEFDFAPIARGRNLLTRRGDLRGGVAGILAVPRGLLMAVMQPVLKSDGSGSPAGFFIIGRFLTEARRQNYSSRIGVDFSLTPRRESTDAQLADDTAAAVYYPNSPIVYKYDDLALVSTQALPDVFGKYALELKANTPRSITNMGKNINRMCAVFLAVVSLLFVLLSWVSIRWLVVDPVTRLRKHISAVRTPGDLSLTPDLGRRDEMGALAYEFGQMGQALQYAHVDLQNARDDALSSARKKSEFLASMSHEIRTPMNGVIGMTEMLLKTELSNSQLRLVDTVKTSANSLLNIINDILDFSKINAGKVLIDNKTFSLISFIRDINAAVTEPAQHKGLEYIFLENDDLPSGVIGDDLRIRQVLLNLVGNAIKFTEEGEVVLSVTCKRTWQENEKEYGLLEFAVSDTGIGIREAAQKEIFSAFSQGDSSTTREFGGTGLGLSISKQLVELMGGDIGFDSVALEGTKFWFTMPVEFDRSFTDNSSVPDSSGDAISGLKVMIVDDNDTNRELLLSRMDGWGASAQAYHSADLALIALQLAADNQIHFDLLITDYYMPGMDGIQLAERVSDTDDFRHPVTIILSSMAQEFSQEYLSSMGVSCYLSKPIMRDDLYQKISRVFSASKDSNLKQGVADISVSQPEINMDLCADILVAEDNAVNQELIELLLHGFGCNMVLVENGELALQELASRSFDLVIMDCQMPVMDGFEATRRIREIEILSRAGLPLPILALTANAMEGDRERCLRAGMDAYLAKPFSSDELSSAIRELFVAAPAPVLASVELDQSALDSVRAMQREGEPDMLTRLIDVYLQSSPPLIKNLERGVLEQDAKAIEISAHTLKSSSAHLGASQFSATCQQVEALGRAGDLASIAPLANQLVNEFDQVCKALMLERHDES